MSPRGPAGGAPITSPTKSVATALTAAGTLAAKAGAYRGDSVAARSATGCLYLAGQKAACEARGWTGAGVW